MRSMISSICFAVYFGGFILNLMPAWRKEPRQLGSRMHAAHRRAFRADRPGTACCDYEPGTFLYLYKLAHSQSNGRTCASNRALFLFGAAEEPSEPLDRCRDGHGMSCCLEDQKPQLPAPQPPAGAFLLARLNAGLGDGGRKWRATCKLRLNSARGLFSVQSVLICSGKTPNLSRRYE